MFRLNFIAHAQTEDWSTINPACETNGVANLQGFECIFKNIILIIVPLAGLAAFVVIITAGFKYLTAAGDPKKLQAASGTLTTAVIGIVVVVFIYFIFKLIEAITGLDLLKFQVPV